MHMPPTAPITYAPQMILHTGAIPSADSGCHQLLLFTQAPHGRPAPGAQHSLPCTCHGSHTQHQLSITHPPWQPRPAPAAQHPAMHRSWHSPEQGPASAGGSYVGWQALLPNSSASTAFDACGRRWEPHRARGTGKTAEAGCDEGHMVQQVLGLTCQIAEASCRAGEPVLLRSHQHHYHNGGTSAAEVVGSTKATRGLHKATDENAYLDCGGSEL
jgi:hypothetical protein